MEVIYIRQRDGSDLCFPHAVRAIMLHDEKVKAYVPSGNDLVIVSCVECRRFKEEEAVRHAIRVSS